jgi:phenylacetate-CoA ligase
MPGVTWPAISSPHGAAKLALLHQLEQTQWLAPQQVREAQRRQLEVLLRHAAATVPYYRAKWGEAVSPGDFDALPVLLRRDLQESFDAFRSEAIPREHGSVGEVRTSGSTGAPTRVLKAQLSQFFWETLTLREHLWHRRDLSGKLAAIRRGAKGSRPSWGSATDGVFTTGPAVGMQVEADVEEQLAWLQRENPRYILTYPSLLREMANTCLARGLRLPALHQARTLSEVVFPELRRLCREAWGVPVTDMYSAEEVGHIALQCPDHEHYHVQAETVLVEVVDEQGRACPAGSQGRVLVTDLHNFATPLIRYDIGDFAEVGPPCPCGRGLPVLTRIIGRTRNLLVTADGKRHYPFLGQSQFLDIAPILQHQFVQTAYDVVEARIVMREAPTAEQMAALSAHVEKHMPAGIRVKVVRVESIARGPGGKYEDVISLVERSGHLPERQKPENATDR